jgi:hypothetical protein
MITPNTQEEPPKEAEHNNQNSRSNNTTATGMVFDAINEIWDKHDDPKELFEIIEACLDVASCIAGGFLGADEAPPILRSYLERAIDRLPEQNAERQRETEKQS